MSRAIFQGCASLICALSFGTIVSPLHALDIEGAITAQGRWFISSTDDPRQSVQDVSLAGELRIAETFDNRRQRLVAAVNGRVDSDDGQRSQWDLSELNWQYRWRQATLTVGLDRVFWGTTEALHLVDTINQTNRVDSPDGERKLGQPMVHLSFTPGRATVSLIVMPYFREQRLPGSRGRLRGPLELAVDNATFESGDDRRHLDFAIRYASYRGAFSWALSHFSGTNRTPLLRLLPADNPFSPPRLAPFYFLTDRSGLELSYVRNSWLWKLEALSARDDQQRYFAATGGFEYSLYSVAETAADIGLIMEYQYDSRDSDRLLQSVSLANDDLVLGTRVALNDFSGSEFRALYSYDLGSGGRITSIEASRRFGNDWRGSITARFFSGEPSVDALAVFADEDHWQIELTRFF